MAPHYPDAANGRLFLLAGLLYPTAVAQTGREHIANPSPDTYILAEESSDELYGYSSVRISSDVPVTIQRYSDSVSKILLLSTPIF